MAIAAKPITRLQEVKDVCELAVHPSTISRRLKGHAIDARVPAVKEFLTTDQKAQRLQFVQS
ncbi:hypothetical protein DAPPUDRAFT_317759 [Daphnia pulex]|uniref:Transposase Tc1-like domain-containing protein n=1 Tax=Daphnia pulex TaxID=6669 RepID=E9GGW5_DAPPU|nr:hypothetical protein DAPPUDRAFT_317759 [Daphnia pulex]|eukprot:EFX81095.1 hypothetical protein DAPPUDRAFT_317759 [Daphnia pulex]